MHSCRFFQKFRDLDTIFGEDWGMAHLRNSPQPEVPGLVARKIAVDILDGVLRRHIALDEQLAGKTAHPGLPSLADRDRALMRRLAATALRRLGTLRHLLGAFLERGFPSDAPRVETILLVGAAQILWLDVPDHAAVDLSVRLAQADRRAARYAGLVNAVLRRVAQNRATLAVADGFRDTPDWLLKRWTARYGAAAARAIATANGHEPALDVTVKADAANWAEHLRGRVLPTGTVRTLAHGVITLLPGFAEGAWWVQDAAAALPVRLFGDVRGLDVVDLCAAPGGKTAQLANAGARVTAVDRSRARLARVAENFARLGLTAETVAADALDWQGGPFDAVLLDAPCSSTGTIRRHPDVPWLKSEADLAVLTSLQQRLLDRAVALHQARRAPGLLRLFAGTGGRRAADRRPAHPRHAAGPRAGDAGGSLRPCRIRQPPTATCAPYRCTCPDPDPRWGGLRELGASSCFRAASCAMGSNSRPDLAYWPCAAPSLSCEFASASRRDAPGDEQVHDAGFGRGAIGALGAHRTPRVPQSAWHRQRASAHALALRLGQDRPHRHRAAGSAYRGRHPRERDLCRPFRFRRQGGDRRSPIAVRDRAALRRMGRASY